MKRKNILFSLLLILSLTFAACSNDKTANDLSSKEESVEKSQEIKDSSNEEKAKVIALKDFPEEFSPIEDYEKDYKAQVESFKKNSLMEETTYGGSVPIDYLEVYPYLKDFYKGYGFEKQYDRAKGHIYALEDVINTKRPKAGASCLACKVSVYNKEVLEDESIASMDFDDYVNSKDIVGFTCFDCHGDSPGIVQISRYHMRDILEDNPNEDYLKGNMLACAQCHDEYYMTDEKLVSLPWKEGLGADEAYKYYQDLGFFDWEHELTGAKMLKAQHPEVETFLGSTHQKAGLDCISCHMPKVEVEGEKISSHHWTSPLKYPEESCLKCHSDMTKESIVELAESVQKPVFEKTEEVALKLQAYIYDLAEEIESGNLDQKTKEELQEIHRQAQFYWDYVFVENSEGFHNSKKALEYLDFAESLLDKAEEILKN